MGRTAPGTSVQMWSAPMRHALAPIAAALLTALVCSAAWAQQTGGEPAAFVYSPWMKHCNKDKNQPAAKDVCETVREARLENGQQLAAVAVIEQEGEQKKVLRITIPLGMQLPQGTRVVVDQDPPITGRYTVCIPNGCMADFEIDAGFVGKLKKAQNITLQGINLPGQAASYAFPLAEFAKANEGPATERARGAATEPLFHRIQCAGASELCAWKRIPGRR